MKKILLALPLFINLQANNPFLAYKNQQERIALQAWRLKKQLSTEHAAQTKSSKKECFEKNKPYDSASDNRISKQIGEMTDLEVYKRFMDPVGRNKNEKWICHLAFPQTSKLSDDFFEQNTITNNTLQQLLNKNASQGYSIFFE